MYEVISVTSIDAIWPFVAPWIAQALEAEDMGRDLEVIKTNCKSGGARIIIQRDHDQSIRGVLVTESWIQDGRKVLVIRWLCGKCVDEWLEDKDLFEGLAFANGFHAIQIWGRPGWIKRLKSLGYTHEFTVMGKPLIRGLH